MDAEKMTKRLDEWIIENKEEWYTICGQGRYPLTEEEYMELHEKLIEDAPDHQRGYLGKN